MDGLFHWQESRHQWERVERVQYYNGVKIESITSHGDWDGARNHRAYLLTYQDGRTALFGINKRGGNIKEIKQYLDIKSKYNLL